MVDDDLLRRLARLDSCAVSDALDTADHDGVVLGLSALSSARRIVGRAVTVQLAPSDGRKTARHLGTAAVEAAGPDSVIVVANDGRLEVAGWGGILSQAAKRRAVAGIIIDGACRDIDEAREVDMPIYAKSGVPRTARGRIVERDWNVPVVLAGIAIAPGDYVIADASGVVVIPQQLAEQIIKGAERIVAKEKLMAEAVRRGESVSSVMGTNYETMLDGAGR